MDQKATASVFATSCLFVALLSFTCSAGVAGGNAAHFQGDLTAASVEAFIAGHQARRLERLIITSAGGNVTAGITLGEWVFSRQLDVVVQDYCLSSCANYVFTAAHHKTIRPGAIVAWHGSYILLEKTGDWRTEIPLRMQKYKETANEAALFIATQVKKLAQRERQFFAHIGVDPVICYLGKLPPYNVPNYFSLAPGDMSRFGVAQVEAPADYPPPRMHVLGQEILGIKLNTE